MRVLDLFSGIGGFSLGLTWANSLRPHFAKLIDSVERSSESGGSVAKLDRHAWCERAFSEHFKDKD